MTTDQIKNAPFFKRLENWGQNTDFVASNTTTQMHDFRIQEDRDNDGDGFSKTIM